MYMFVEYHHLNSLPVRKILILLINHHNNNILSSLFFQSHQIHQFLLLSFFLAYNFLLFYIFIHYYLISTQYLDLFVVLFKENNKMEKRLKKIIMKMKKILHLHQLDSQSYSQYIHPFLMNLIKRVHLKYNYYTFIRMIFMEYDDKLF